jgi:hypothetical protein
MATIVFDTHAFVKELAEAGMPEKQAGVLARWQARLINEKCWLARKQAGHQAGFERTGTEGPP